MTGFELIDLQDQMQLPIGPVLKESGEKPLATHLLDPHRAPKTFAKYTSPIAA